MAKKHTHRLGDLLVEHRVITKKQLKQALDEQKKDAEGRRLGRILVDLNYVGEETLMSFLAKQCGIPHLKLGEYEIDSEVITYVSPELVLQYQAVPIDKLGKILTVAMVDPLDEDAKEGLTKATGFVVKPIVCSEKDIDEAIERYYGAGVLEASREHRRSLAGKAAGEGAAGAVEESLEGLRPLKPYIFDDFVIGHANQFTYATARAVADAPAHDYNPLFIYSGVGLGKTHLINAIGNQILESDPGMNVVYLSSERFTAELVHAIQKNDIKSFRRRYREVDVLLLDDIHFLAGKERAQEEFFHTFNELYNAHKQIVATSDRPPKSMLTLEKRLRSRFEGGIITDIQPPEYETRLAILHKKLERMDQKVDDAVLVLLAERITSNIRELEGALRGVIATSEATEKSLTVKFAERVLDDILGESEAISKEKEAEQEILEIITKADAGLQDVIEAGVESENPEGVEYIRSQLEVANQALQDGDLSGARSAAMDARERAVALLREQEESRQIRARERLESSINEKLTSLREAISAAEAGGVDETSIARFTDAVREIEAELVAGDLVPAETRVNKLLKELGAMEEKVEAGKAKAEAAVPMAIEWELTAVEAELDRFAAMAKGHVRPQTAEAERLLSEAKDRAKADDAEAARELLDKAKSIVASLKESLVGEAEDPQKVDAEQSVENAAAAIEAARDEGAAELAEDKLEEADDLYINAEAMLEAEEYDEALAYALRAEEAAQEATESALNQKIAMRKEETEANLTKVTDLLKEARKAGADEYAVTELNALQEKETEVRTASSEEKVEEAFELSAELVSSAQSLLDITKARKTVALKQALGDILSSAGEVVTSSKSRGASKYCAKELIEIEELLAEGKRLLMAGELEKGLEITGNIPARAQELARKTNDAREAEEALRLKTRETLKEAESILQGALAAGALRYALKPFQEAQVSLARAHELVDDEDPEKAFKESQSVFDQAQKVIEVIEHKKVEVKRSELTLLAKQAERDLGEAVESGADKYAPSLLGEARSVLSSIGKALEEERFEDGLALKGQLQELVKQTKQETNERRAREEAVKRHCEELMVSAREYLEEARILEAEQYAPDQLEQTSSQIAEVDALLQADSVDEAEIAAQTALSLAESLLAATREERAGEMRRTLEGFVETLGDMLSLIIETGGRRYTPGKVASVEESLQELSGYLESGRLEVGLEAAEPLEIELLALQEETEKHRQEEEELRKATNEKLKQADSILAEARAEGAEEYAEDSLKNVQALFARAREVSHSDNARKAFELARGVVDRAAKLRGEAKVRKAEALRARLSELVTELHRTMAEARSKEVGRYAPELFKKAQDFVKNMEAALRSQEYDTGIDTAADARSVLEKAIETTRIKREEEERLRKEAETRLAEAAKKAMEAENEGAKVHAPESLANYRRSVQEIKDCLVRGEIEKAYRASEGIGAMADSLLEEAIIAKTRAMQQQITQGLTSADTLIEEVEESGAGRFMPDGLSAVRELRGEVARLMEGGELSAGVERVEALLRDAEQLKKDVAKKKKEGEDFKNRVAAALERAEQAIRDATEAGAVGKELKKTEVFLAQARRAQDANQMDKSLKFSSLATRKAMELMAGPGVTFSGGVSRQSADFAKTPSVSAQSKATLGGAEAEEVIIEESLPSLRPKSKTRQKAAPLRSASKERVVVDPKTRKELEKEFPLIVEMSFENYQVGDVNRFTYQTAQAVAESPGTAMYNPLFVHGAVGVGKTHLMTATGWRVRKLNPDALVIYMSSEKFANALVEAIEMDAVEDLRNRLSLADVLLIDDIQFLAGRERAQEDFVHIFTILVNQNRQVIISSDRPPGELTTLADRLRSRFETGFVTDLQLPEAAIRERILRQQADREGLDIGDDVLKLLAEHINTNLRELQGSLKKLVAHCRLTDSAFTLSAAVEVLRSIMPDIEVKIDTEPEEEHLLTEERRLLEEEERLRVEEERLVAEEERILEEEERLAEDQ